MAPLPAGARRVGLVVNPTSGKNRGMSLGLEVAHRLRAAGHITYTKDHWATAAGAQPWPDGDDEKRRNAWKVVWSDDDGQVQGAAFYQLGRARQTETWPALQEEQIPTLLLLATEPPAAFEQNRRAAHAFRAVIHTAEVQLLEGATHSLVTDLRWTFGQLVLEFLQKRP